MGKKIIIIIISGLVIIGFLFWLDPNQFFTKLVLTIRGDYAAPEYESQASILENARDNQLYYDRLYRLSGVQAMNDFKQKHIFQIPFVHIYNSRKESMSMASGGDCKWSLIKFFNEKDGADFVLGDSTMYDFILQRLEPVDIKSKRDTFDYYMLAGWAKYAPRLSDSLFAQTNRMKKSLDKKICYTYINLDFQEEWEAELEAPKK